MGRLPLGYNRAMAQGGSFVKGFAKWVIVPLALVGVGYLIGEKTAKAGGVDVTDSVATSEPAPTAPDPVVPSKPVSTTTPPPKPHVHKGPTMEVSAQAAGPEGTSTDSGAASDAGSSTTSNSPSSTVDPDAAPKPPPVKHHRHHKPIPAPVPTAPPTTDGPTDNASGNSPSDVPTPHPASNPDGGGE